MSDKSSANPDMDATVVAPSGKYESVPESAGTEKSGVDSPQKKTQVLGDFKILKKLGQGGMGAVYLAHQISLDRPCALKVMSPEIAKKQDFVQRFIREARVMAKIEHPSVVRCYAVGEHKGMYYVAMELIDGTSMQNWINTLTTLSVGDALHITIVCAQALAHAHKMNLIHRDIKPDNILVTRNGAVKVADLGLAKAVDEDNSMTQSGTGMGTPLYMPPEQARNAKYVDQRSDIYALGCTLYKFLTGVPPYTADSTMELIIAKEKGKFTPAAKLNREIPERLDLIIDKMIAKDAQHRYQTCDELLTDIIGLSLESPSLSFIDSEEKVILGAALPSTVQAAAQTGSIRQGKTLELPKTSREEAQQQKLEQARTAKDSWHVRFTDRAGKVQVKKMTTDQVHRGLATKLLNEQTQVTKNPQRPLTSIGSFPEFKDQIQEILHAKADGKRKQNMQDIYQKLDRQHGRRKWWRLLENIKDGTLGWIGLLIWLAIVAAVGYGLYVGVPLVWQIVANNFGLG